MIHIRVLFALVALFVAVSFAPAFAAVANEPVDINQAGIEQLEALDGIGAAKARAIVEFRDANGPFATVDDLRNVSGIGDKLLASLRPQVTVGPAGGAKSDAR